MSKNLIRIAVYPVDAVLRFVFTKEIRRQLRENGIGYTDAAWKQASSREFPVLQRNGIIQMVRVPMGSHRYELFASKGIACCECGIVGRFFALERSRSKNPNKFHFNLYGYDENGRERMITKDHIIPRSRGGKNVLSNYQTMCVRCNQRKGNKLPV